MSREDDTFIDRWSRRKRAAADAEEVAVPDPAPDADSEIPEEELLEKLGLPDPDTLKDGDDFAAFMRSGVPDILRRRALKALWRSNPALANLDGLLEYGEDYTDAAMVPEVLNTIYQVGKGLLPEIAEAEDPDPLDDVPQEATAEAQPDKPELDQLPESDVKTIPEPVDNEEEITSFAPKRMTFNYD